MICPNCNKVYSDDFDFCPYCGTSKPELLSCPKCGFESNEFKFCPKCGVELTKNIETQICSNCGHEYPINRPFCEKCGNGFSNMLKPKNTNISVQNNNEIEQNNKISEQSKKMLLKYVEKFAIEKSKKDEIKKQIEDGRITTKTEVTRIVRNIEKKVKEEELKIVKEKKRVERAKKEKEEKEREEKRISAKKSEINYINYLLDNGKYNDAIQYIYNVIGNNKESAHLWNLLGIAYSKIGQHGAALNAFDKAINYDRDCDGYWANAANTLTLFGILNLEEKNIAKGRRFLEEASLYYTEAMTRSYEEKYIVEYRRVLLLLKRTEIFI